MRINFGHFGQSDLDFEVWGAHTGEVQPVTLVLDEDEGDQAEEIMAEQGLFWTEAEAQAQADLEEAEADLLSLRAEADPGGDLQGSWDPERRDAIPVHKGLDRAGLMMTDESVVMEHRTGYKDRDVLLYVRFVVSNPQMGRSATDLEVEALLPIHQATPGYRDGWEIPGKVTLGAQCGHHKVTEPFSQEKTRAHQEAFRGFVRVSWKEDGGPWCWAEAAPASDHLWWGKEKDTPANHPVALLMDVFALWKRAKIEEALADL